MAIHPLVLFLPSFTAAITGRTIQHPSLQRQRILKQTTAPPTVSDRLEPSASKDNSDACSCSPTKFTFRIDLSQSCDNDDISENAGIESAFCIVEDGSGGNGNEDSNREPLRQLKTSTVVEITSVQFLEFRPDPSLEVMYTDDTYLNTTLTNGDTITFYSSSSYLPSVAAEQEEEYVPGGVSLILHGKTEDGTTKRNRFYWLYDEAVTDCSENSIVPGINVGDAVGWVVVDAVAGPWPQFCPAASPTSPTITPRTLDPSAAPTSYSVIVEKSKSSKFSFVESSSKSSKVEVDTKADKYSGKSSKSSGYFDHKYSSKGYKGSVDSSSKSGKSSDNTYYNYKSTSMSYSLSMQRSSDPTGSPTFSESYMMHHDYNGSKAGKFEMDSKAVKTNVKSSESTKPAYVSKTDKGFSMDGVSKSGKDHDGSENTKASSSYWKSSSENSHEQAQGIDAKADKYGTKAYKILPTKSKSGKGLVLPSKSYKSYEITDHDEIGSISMSHSLSMSLETPSKTTSPTASHYHAQVVDSKADKTSGKSSKRKPAAEANSEMSSDSWSKSSKSHGVDRLAVEKDSMSYSLSMSSNAQSEMDSHSQQYYEGAGDTEQDHANSKSSKSGKADRKAYHPASPSRDLKSERAAVDDVDCTGTECIDCFPVSSAPTIDGGTFDWATVQSFEFPLTHALDRSEYSYGNLKMKCVHDSNRIYFLFEVPGPFRFDPENNHRCPSVSTMFKMGPDAMYYNMGNCPHAATSCADDPSLCTDYKVDIGGHWEMRRTEMGVKYGIGEPAGDGNIANEYAYSPYCHGDDNDPDASNEWEGAWIHTSPIEGDLGTYIFEMSRSLKTSSSVTDAQLEAGEAIDFGFAYWHPYELSNGWTHAGHYITGGSVDWLSLRLIGAATTEAPTPNPIDPSTLAPTTSPTDPSTKEPTPTPSADGVETANIEPTSSQISSSGVDASQTNAPIEHEVEPKPEMYSSKSSKSDPDNEDAWAGFPLSNSPTNGKAGKQIPGLTSGKAEKEVSATNVPIDTASSKSGKSMSLHGATSAKPSSGPTAFKPTGTVLSSLHDEFQSSKSSKSNASHSTSSKAEKIEDAYTTAVIVSKSGKGVQSNDIDSSMSYSLSMSLSYSMPGDQESNEPRLEKNSVQSDPPTVGSVEPASSPSLDTDFGFSSDNTNTVSEVRSSNGGKTPRSLATALILLLLQLAI